jgi:hypothetical protein
MVGISADILLWIDHLLLMVLRIRPKINLKGLIIKNGDAEAIGIVIYTEGFSVPGNTFSFKPAGYYSFHETNLLVTCFLNNYS